MRSASRPITRVWTSPDGSSASPWSTSARSPGGSSLDVHRRRDRHDAAAAAAGRRGEVLTPTLPIGIAAFVWGVVACAVDALARRRPAGSSTSRSCSGALAIAVATHDTGGADSPARLLTMLVLVFAAYFFRAREAWPYLALVLALHELPLAYDPTALDSGLLGELLIVAPCYWLLAFLLITGKRGMIELRARADELARTDPLTGLANRRALIEAMDGAGGARATSGRAADARRRRLQARSTPLRPPGRRPRAGLRRRLPAHELPRRRPARAARRRRVRRAGPAAPTRPGWRRSPSACWTRSGSATPCGSASAGRSARGDDALLHDADNALAEAKRGGKDRALSAARPSSTDGSGRGRTAARCCPRR